MSLSGQGKEKAVSSHRIMPCAVWGERNRHLCMQPTKLSDTRLACLHPSNPRNVKLITGPLCFSPVGKAIGPQRFCGEQGAKLSYLAGSRLAGPAKTQIYPSNHPLGEKAKSQLPTDGHGLSRMQRGFVTSPPGLPASTDSNSWPWLMLIRSVLQSGQWPCELPSHV